MPFGPLRLLRDRDTAIRSPVGRLSGVRQSSGGVDGSRRVFGNPARYLSDSGGYGEREMRRPLANGRIFDVFERSSTRYGWIRFWCSVNTVHCARGAASVAKK